MRPVNAILIDPFTCTVTEVKHDADRYREIYGLISHESMHVGRFEVSYPILFKPRDGLFVDEEGLLKPCDRFFFIAGHLQPLAGKGLILGADHGGKAVSCKTPVYTVRAVTTFLHRIGNELIPINEPWTAPKENA